MTEAEVREIVERYEALLSEALSRLSYRPDTDEVPRLLLTKGCQVRLEITSLEVSEDDDGRPCGGFLSRSSRPVSWAEISSPALT